MPEFQPAGSVRVPTQSATAPKLPNPHASYRPVKVVVSGTSHALKGAIQRSSAGSFSVKSASAPSERQVIPTDRRSGTLPRHADPRAQCQPNQHPHVDLAIQRALVGDEYAVLKRKRMEQWQAAAKLSPKEGRHSLLMLVTEAYRWRRDAAQPASLLSSPKDSAPSIGAPSVQCCAIPVPNNSVREVPAVLNVHSNPDEFYGVVADIESLMTKPDVVQSGDSKNVYQKILQNLGQLGLFRPEPAGPTLPVSKCAPPSGLAPDY